jgi:hypothetical protein
MIGRKPRFIKIDRALSSENMDAVRAAWAGIVEEYVILPHGMDLHVVDDGVPAMRAQIAAQAETIKALAASIAALVKV